MNSIKTYVAQIGDKTLTIETGLLAQQAGAAVTVRLGESVVLCTATASGPRDTGGEDFFPLTVDFEERLYAAGRIPGSFFRREGRPTEQAILTSRLIDRPLRPLFPKDYRNEVQVIATALSSDSQNYLDIPSIIGASAALTLSDIPFLGPIGACRVGLIEDEFVINPTADQMEASLLDLRMASTADALLMVEAGASEVHEEVMLQALEVGHKAMQEVIALQERMRAEIGKPKALDYPVKTIEDAERATILGRIGDRVGQLIARPLNKREWAESTKALQAEIVQSFDGDESVEPAHVRAVFDDVLKAEMRRKILEQGVRADGRKTDEIRPISTMVGLLPRVHGSGLFTRGETQVLSIATLGTPREEQKLDTLRPEEVKRYMHHYNFPSFSTGETWANRGPRRREIGHGALAETALRAMIPAEETFPYTVRVVSEVLSSNGSTSMASVCGSSLALMDAGVPIKSPVAGIAMGLISENDRYAILSDIQGLEDHLGDMDFKVAGTREGITALQMDIKIKGLSSEILSRALAQARNGRMFILDRMAESLPEARGEMSPYAPRITTIHVDPDKIGKIIGPGGKMIRKIQEECGVEIDIQDDGSVFISASEGPAVEKAIAMVEGLTEEASIGRVYVGKVVRTEAYGAFVEILPGVDGLVHISQLADYRVPSVEDVVHVGDEVMVMVIDIDQDTGKIRLSRQAVLEGWTAEEAREKDRKSAPANRSGGGREGSRGGRPSRGPHVGDSNPRDQRPPRRDR
ncbi:MAG TPA: polyribonucleotide nucleotidyltransferase [Anaerolineae bacterium]|nr:polyribonucleotide nucleotidyltransferase [Anaerolineae bacterium]